jgi:hypothetical protein
MPAKRPAQPTTFLEVVGEPASKADTTSETDTLPVGAGLPAKRPVKATTYLDIYP